MEVSSIGSGAGNCQGAEFSLRNSGLKGLRTKLLDSVAPSPLAQSASHRLQGGYWFPRRDMASGKTYCAGQWTHRDERTQCLGIQFYHKVLCDPVSMSSAYHRDDCHRDNQNGHQAAMPGGLRLQLHATGPLKKL